MSVYKLSITLLAFNIVSHILKNFMTITVQLQVINEKVSFRNKNVFWTVFINGQRLRYVHFFLLWWHTNHLILQRIFQSEILMLLLSYYKETSYRSNIVELNIFKKDRLFVSSENFYSSFINNFFFCKIFSHKYNTFHGIERFLNYKIYNKKTNLALFNEVHFITNISLSYNIFILVVLNKLCFCGQQANER